MKGFLPVGLLALLGVELMAGFVYAETVELVTYYPATATTGDLHTRSLTVGNDYLAVGLDDGEAIIRTSLGIGPGFDAAVAGGVLHVVGEDNAAAQALFMPGGGTGTMRVGIGTATPSNTLHILSGTPSIHIQPTADSIARDIVFGIAPPAVVGTAASWQLSARPNTETPPSSFAIANYPGGVFTPRLTLTTGGNVGIGTAAPAASAAVEMASTTRGFLPPRMTTAQRQAIAAPAAGLVVYDTTARALMFFDGAQWQAVGASVPIGTIVAWHKSAAGTPALPAGWVECNGQVLNDPQSPYNGQRVPDLNNLPPTNRGGTYEGGRFLRGGTTSGVLQDATGHLFEAANAHPELYFSMGGYNGAPGADGVWDADTLQVAVISSAYARVSPWGRPFPGSPFASRPVNMSVVWIIRVK